MLARINDRLNTMQNRASGVHPDTRRALIAASRHHGITASRHRGITVVEALPHQGRREIRACYCTVMMTFMCWWMVQVTS
jgi:hypothetical protein